MTAQEFKYTNYMTLEEWKKFKFNYEKFCGEELPIKDYLIEKSLDSFTNFISCAFLWEKLPNYIHIGGKYQIVQNL